MAAAPHPPPLQPFARASPRRRLNRHLNRPWVSSHTPIRRWRNLAPPFASIHLTRMPLDMSLMSRISSFLIRPCFDPLLLGFRSVSSPAWNWQVWVFFTFLLKRSDLAQDRGPCAMLLDASVRFSDNLTHLPISMSRPHQIVPIRFHQRRAKLFSATAIELKSAEECTLRPTVEIHQHERRFINLPRTRNGRSRNLVDHDVGLNVNPSSSTVWLHELNPAVTSHQLVGARTLLAHMVGQNQDVHRGLSVSLRWVLSLIDHARLLFVAILHGDHASASLIPGSPQ